MCLFSFLISHRCKWCTGIFFRKKISFEEVNAGFTLLWVEQLFLYQTLFCCDTHLIVGWQWMRLKIINVRQSSEVHFQMIKGSILTEFFYVLFLHWLLHNLQSKIINVSPSISLAVSQCVFSIEAGLMPPGQRCPFGVHMRRTYVHWRSGERSSHSTRVYFPADRTTCLLLFWFALAGTIVWVADRLFIFADYAVLTCET